MKVRKVENGKASVADEENERTEKAGGKQGGLGAEHGEMGS